MDTSLGTIKIELDGDKAPITVKNFLAYVDDKFYDGTTFHRVIPTFMIQGGGFPPGLKDAKSPKDVQALEKKTKEPIKNEASNGVHNEAGTIAMARTNELDSATSQFFINTKNNDFLDKANARDRVGYCVFGRVIEGLDVVDKIRMVKTGAKGMFDSDCPQEDVVIQSVKRAETPK